MKAFFYNALFLGAYSIVMITTINRPIKNQYLVPRISSVQNDNPVRFRVRIFTEMIQAQKGKNFPIRRSNLKILRRIQRKYHLPHRIQKRTMYLLQ